jgi:hypothetical protein
MAVPIAVPTELPRPPRPLVPSRTTAAIAGSTEAPPSPGGPSSRNPPGSTPVKPEQPSAMPRQDEPLRSPSRALFDTWPPHARGAGLTLSSIAGMEVAMRAVPEITIETLRQSTREGDVTR